MTFTNALAQERIREKTLRRLVQIATFLMVPVTAGAVYFFLTHHAEPAHHAAVAIPRIEANAAPAANEKSLSPLPVASTARAEAKPVGMRAPVAEEFTTSIIKFSLIQPPKEQEPATLREKNVLTLNLEEYGNAHKILAADPSAKLLADETAAKAEAAALREPVACQTMTAHSAEEKAYIDRCRETLIDTAYLGNALRLFGTAKFIEPLKRNVLAWAETYRPMGQPEDDVALEPILRNAALVTLYFSSDEKRFFDDWLLTMGDREITLASARNINNDLTYAQHLEVIALIGFLTENGNYQSYSKMNFSTHLAAAFKDNGQSSSLEQFDSVARHAAHMKSLLATSILYLRAARANRDLLPIYGTPLQKALDVVTTAIAAPEPHMDFAKPLDAAFKLKQNNGDPDAQPRVFVSTQALALLENALFFRPELVRIVPTVVGRPNVNYGTVDALINYAMNRNTRDFAAPLPPETKTLIREPANKSSNTTHSR